MSTLISVDKLWISSKQRPLVKDVSFTLDSTSSVGLIGESGSGKSLIGAALMGLLPEELQVSGTISYKGKSLNHSSEFRSLRKTDLSIVFQNPMSSLNPTMPIGEQLSESFLEKVSSTEILKLLKQVELNASLETLDKYPHQFSGGERQRILLAMALAKKPKVLIADEPTTALDVTLQKALLVLLKRLQKEYGFALLFITHDLAILKALCDKVMVLFSGVLLEKGSVEEILEAPKHPYTQALIKAYPHEDLHLDMLDNNLHNPPSNSGCPFITRCPYAMEICLKRLPDLAEKCWLYDKRAPKRDFV